MRNTPPPVAIHYPRPSTASPTAAERELEALLADEMQQRYWLLHHLNEHKSDLKTFILEVARSQDQQTRVLPKSQSLRPMSADANKRNRRNSAMPRVEVPRSPRAVDQAGPAACMSPTTRTAARIMQRSHHRRQLSASPVPQAVASSEPCSDDAQTRSLPSATNKTGMPTDRTHRRQHSAMQSRMLPSPSQLLTLAEESDSCCDLPSAIPTEHTGRQAPVSTHHPRHRRQQSEAPQERFFGGAFSFPVTSPFPADE